MALKFHVAAAAVLALLFQFQEQQQCADAPVQALPAFGVAVFFDGRAVPLRDAAAVRLDRVAPGASIASVRAAVISAAAASACLHA